MVHGRGTSKAICIVILTMLEGVFASRLTSQTTSATLSGVVRDSTGAVVPQVRVTLRSIAKGTSRATVTDGEGAYSFSFGSQLQDLYGQPMS